MEPMRRIEGSSWRAWQKEVRRLPVQPVPDESGVKVCQLVRRQRGGAPYAICKGACEDEDCECITYQIMGPGNRIVTRCSCGESRDDDD
jgi:hypothetical protein